jgi:hypothetical protein
MSYHPRIETDEFSNFLTSRTRNSELWFINNQPLEEAILGYLAKYALRYTVTLYAFAIEGSHLHHTLHFPKPNRAKFMQDFKSNVARAVPRYCPWYPGGSLFGRRFSYEILPAADDVEAWFFYTVLQPVNDGLVSKISEYPGYNCFDDAVSGRKRVCKVMNWTAYYEARRYNKRAQAKDFIEEYELEYQRLPGYEHLSQPEYKKLMLEKLEVKRQEILEKRRVKGKTGFLGRERLLKIRQGARPKNPKTSTRTSHRPRVLCVCPNRRAETLDWYFGIYFAYKEASFAYRGGNYDVQFPPGTYKPALPLSG